MICSEVAIARRRGIPVEGICLYPVLNHLGWDNDRDCQNGLYARDTCSSELIRYEPLFEAMEEAVRRDGRNARNSGEFPDFVHTGGERP